MDKYIVLLEKEIEKSVRWHIIGAVICFCAVAYFAIRLFLLVKRKKQGENILHTAEEFY